MKVQARIIDDLTSIPYVTAHWIEVVTRRQVNSTNGSGKYGGPVIWRNCEQTLIWKNKDPMHY